MRHRARGSGSKFARCAAILIYCSLRDWTRFCYVIVFENIRIHPSTRYQIHCGFIFFHSGERMIRCGIRWIRVDGSRIWKEKVADSKISGFAVEFAGYVWTEAVSGKKKLRIQKYPDTCGRCLTSIIIITLS